MFFCITFAALFGVKSKFVIKKIFKMNLLDLTKNDTHQVQVVVSAKDLQSFADYLINNAKQENPAEGVLISSKKAAELLKVSRQTLYRWNASGYLKSQKRGALHFYNLADVERLAGKGVA